jgi:hypothetical protein
MKSLTLFIATLAIMTIPHTGHAQKAPLTLRAEIINQKITDTDHTALVPASQTITSLHHDTLTISQDIVSHAPLSDTTLIAKQDQLNQAKTLGSLKTLSESLAIQNGQVLEENNQTANNDQSNQNGSSQTPNVVNPPVVYNYTPTVTTTPAPTTVVTHSPVVTTPTVTHTATTRTRIVTRTVQDTGETSDVSQTDKSLSRKDSSGSRYAANATGTGFSINLLTVLILILILVGFMYLIGTLDTRHPKKVVYVAPHAHTA